MVARYNVYFNGTLKLNAGIEALKKANKDNYKEVLDVYPYGTDENKKSQTAQMDEVVKKASKIINDRKLSKYLDDAYLLMGKAYYFKADYFAAIETFQFINTRFKNTPIAYEATVWIILSYVQLNRSDEAEAIIGLLKNDLNFPSKLKPQFAAASAEVFVQQKKWAIAAENLESAVGKLKPATQRARIHYILGQIYEKQNNREKARLHYNAVIKGNPPYEMAFNARVNLARNYNRNDKSEVRNARKYLKGMLKDDKNISFYDQIYYELGLLEKSEGNMDDAITNFVTSNQNNQNNRDQKALSQLELADIYFNKPNYILAQRYYDSAITFLSRDFERYQQLKTKQEVLTELIKNLLLIQREDSLIKLGLMERKELDKLVDRTIQKEKEEAERLKKEAERKKQNFQGGGAATAPGSSPFQQPIASGGFYFDDQMNVARGFTDFITKWGERPNVDNWKYTAIADNAMPSENSPDPKNPQNKDSADVPKTPIASAIKDVAPEKQVYYKDIPFTEDARRASKARIAQAKLTVGVIYYDPLKELTESYKFLNAFVTDNPKHPEEPKAFYYLYKVLNQQGKVKEADEYKAQLVKLYAESGYARSLTGEKPQPTAASKDTEAIEQLYQKAYLAFESKNFTRFLESKKEHDGKYYGSNLQAKFDLLEAFYYAGIDSTKKTINLLTDITVNHSGTAEALKAQLILNQYESKIAKQKDTTSASKSKGSFTFAPNARHYVMFAMPEGKGMTLNQARARFNDYNKSQYPSESFSVEEMLVGKRTLVVIKEFPNAEKAKAYIKKMLDNRNFLVTIGANPQFLTADVKSIGSLLVSSDLEGFIKFNQDFYQ